MNILFFGVGVLGSLYAARLKEAGHNVSVLARGQRLADLREHGIVLEDVMTGVQTTTSVNIVEQLAPEDAYDLVVVLSRKNQIASVLPALAANHHTPNVLFMVNNAAGPDEYVKALGRERVLLGFTGAGGMRAGYVIRYGISKGQPTIVGELDGQITPRLTKIAEAFRSAGFRVSLCDNMDAWLKTHVALVSPVANALYMAGCDNYRLARTPDALLLMIRAIREGFQVLRALDIPITPPAYKIIAGLPEPLLIPFLRRLFNTRFAEIGMVGHASVARDEMQHIADEFKALALQTSLATPAIDRLSVYIDPAFPPADESSARLPANWHSVIIGLEVLAGVLAVISLLKSRRGIPTHR